MENVMPMQWKKLREIFLEMRVTSLLYKVFVLQDFAGNKLTSYLDMPNHKG